MKCEQCNVDIPASFIKIIEKGICPSCDGEIMSESTRQIREELRDAIAKMEDDPEGLSAWLLSTYDMVPKGTVEATEFHRGERKRKRKSKDDEEYDGGNPIANHFKKGIDDIKRKDPRFAAVAEALSAAKKSSSSGREMTEEEELAALEEKEREEGEALMAQSSSSSLTLDDLAAKALIAKTSGGTLRAADLIKNVDNIADDFSNVTANPDVVSALEEGIFAHDTASMDEVDNHPLMKKRRMDKLLRQGQSNAKTIRRFGED